MFGKVVDHVGFYGSTAAKGLSVFNVALVSTNVERYLDSTINGYNKSCNSIFAVSQHDACDIFHFVISVMISWKFSIMNYGITWKVGSQSLVGKKRCASYFFNHHDYLAELFMY